MDSDQEDHKFSPISFIPRKLSSSLFPRSAPILHLAYNQIAYM